MVTGWWRTFRQKTVGDLVRLGFILVMQMGFVGAIAIALYEQAWLTLFICVAALIVVWIPPILARSFHVHFPLEFELLLNIFIYSSIFLGEIHEWYTRFWWWDLVLHAGAGIVLGIIGFLILYYLYTTGRLNAAPILLSLFSFCFALALGALWEIFEFAVDSIFGFNMQKSGLRDTMWDLIVDAAGAFVAATAGYVYMVRYRKNKTGIFDRSLSRFFGE